MKLVYPDIESILMTDKPGIQTLIVEKLAFFRELLMDFSNQIEGESGKWILSENNKPIELGRNAEILDNFLTFDINKKSLISKITTLMEHEALSEAHLLATSDVLRRFELLFDELAFDFSCDIQTTKLSVGTLLKAVGLEIRDEYENQLERIIDYMELVREFDRNKLFLTVNLRTYFTDEETEAFMRTVEDHGFCMIMVESSEHTLLQIERRVTVDDDLCEF